MADDFLQLFHLTPMYHFSKAIQWHVMLLLVDLADLKKRYWFVIALSNLYLLAFLYLTMCLIAYKKRYISYMHKL